MANERWINVTAYCLYPLQLSMTSPKESSNKQLTQTWQLFLAVILNFLDNDKIFLKLIRFADFMWKMGVIWAEAPNLKF